MRQVISFLLIFTFFGAINQTCSHPETSFSCYNARLEDLVAQDDIVSILTNLIDSDNLPHLLLYGPPGTGKTSTIVAAAKRMYGSSSAYQSMTLELNASDARGIDVRMNDPYRNRLH